MNYLAVSLLLAHLHDQVARKGVRLTYSQNFEAFAELNRDLEERPPLTPMFDPAFGHISSENGFWLKGENDRGEVVHLQALRLDNFSRPLDDVMANWLVPLYRKAGDKPEPADRGLVLSPVARQIHGRTAYHGELWIKAGIGRGALSGLSDTLPRIGLVLAHMKWAPDWIYGFVTKRKVFSGLTARWGYPHAQPNGLCWKQPPRDEPEVEWIVAATQADIANMIEAQLRETMLVTQVTALPLDELAAPVPMVGSSSRS